MANIYITGHRNPDMDSICGALSYAAFKNLTDPQNNYIAVRCSHLSDEVKQVLASLGITPPPYMRNVYPKVEDVMLSSGDRIDSGAALSEYAQNYRDSSPSAIPVFSGGKFEGLLSGDDIVGWYLGKLAAGEDVSRVPTVREVMHGKTLTVQTGELFDDAKKLLQSTQKRGLAVFNGENYAGYVTRRCFLNKPRYELIMVDHNEPGQSIHGIEEANVVEIIDHHRLNSVKTSLPLFIDAEPLGSSCTIIYQLFLRKGIRPDRETARIMLTGILADTVILKSPTTTPTDREAALFLSAVCGVDTETYGRSIFSCIEGLESREPESAISADFKTYTEGSLSFGIGQCEVTTLQNLEAYRDRYLQALEEYRRENGLGWALLMITDVLKECSVLLSTDFPAEKQLQYPLLATHVYGMPGVMSRKKQLLPEILHVISL